MSGLRRKVPAPALRPPPATSCALHDQEKLSEKDAAQEKMMRPALFAHATLAALLVSPARADGPAAHVLTYAEFEQSVPHVDMPLCPVELATEDRFCRMTLANDAINVFVFTTEGDSPLVAFRSWPADLMAGLLD
jgi:hypothetical protein